MKWEIPIWGIVGAIHIALFLTGQEVPWISYWTTYLALILSLILRDKL